VVVRADLRQRDGVPVIHVVRDPGSRKHVECFLFYIGLVRYGDHNRICLEAKAAGCPLISFRGNEYADYWIDEGDQRIIAAQLLMILRGEVPKRETPETPDVSETARAMAGIYERLS